MKARNHNSNICGLSAIVTRPSVTLDTLRLDAKSTQRAQVIAHADDVSRWIAVFPSGAVCGTSGAPMNQTDAEELAAGRGEYHVRMDLVASYGHGGFSC